MSPVSPIPHKEPMPSQPPAPKVTNPALAKSKAGMGMHSGSLLLLAAGACLLLVPVYFFGIAPRLAAKTDLDREQKLSTQRVVLYGTARPAAPKIELPLPGTVQAFQQTSLYARTNGYVKRWLVDIGDVVHEGDLLAELDTPEVDQQLTQAKATAEQAKAGLDIAQTAADRWDAMVKQHAVSQQEADEKDATRNEAKATLDGNLADVARLTDLQNFKQIRAPFTGTITFRDIDVGNLVSSGNGTGTKELYRLAQTDPLRVYVDVPEAHTRSIRAGVEASIHVPAYPDRVFHGEVVRDAGVLDNGTRTLKTEIRVANPDGALLPGAFAEVRLELVDRAPSIIIPANTLIVNSTGTQVARIDNGDNLDKIHLTPVKVGRDFGTEVEILDGVKEGDRLVANPPADMTEGTVVTAKPLPQKIPSPAPTEPPKA
jgi:RND family efflux transporter MFP subunit